MSQRQDNNGSEETPHDMLKRIFAVAELIVRSDRYRFNENVVDVHAKKHKPADLLYRIVQRVNSGLRDGTEEA